MKRLTQKLSALLLIAATLPFTVGTASAATAVPKVAGTWEITGTPYPDGCGPSSSFTNVANISLGGQITNVDPLLGAFVGQAQKLSATDYGIGFFGYLSPAPGLVLNLEVQATLQLVNPGKAAGKFRSIITDPAGMRILSFTVGTTRWSLSPLRREEAGWLESSAVVLT